MVVVGEELGRRWIADVLHTRLVMLHHGGGREQVYYTKNGSVVLTRWHEAVQTTQNAPRRARNL